MAQLASASGLGPEGPVFESQYPDSRADDSSRVVRFFCPLPPGTPNLSTIICLGEKPAVYAGKKGTKNKAESSGEKTIYVPKGCKAAYEKAWAELVKEDGWTITDDWTITENK